jgi:hypothetical protein
MTTLRSRHLMPSPLYLKKQGSNERYFSEKNHEINAGDKKELIEVIAGLLAQSQRGEINMQAPADDYQAELAAAKIERRDAFVKAYYAGTQSQEFKELGAAIGAEVSEVADRMGFMRRFFVKGDVVQGSTVRIHVKTANVTALKASSASQCQPEFVREKYIVPPEWYVEANIMVEERDIQQGAGDILENAFKRTNEQIMVQEDQTIKMLFDNSIGIANNQQILAGGLTPSSLAAIREPILTWGLTPLHLLFAANVWTDISGNAAAWANLLDPVSQYEMVQTGFLGTLFGLGLITDGWRDPNQKVLAQGEIYITSLPDTLGVYTERGPVRSTPIDQRINGRPARGWYFDELVSMTLANPRGVVKATR